VRDADLVAVVLAATIVGEAISPVGWLGLAVVIAGLALLSAPGSHGTSQQVRVI